MARSLWKGWLSFGLVNVPVEVHTAVRDHRPRFRMLHAKDLSPVKFQRVCAKEGKPLAWDDLVKGYEYSRGHFVVLTKDDFKAAALEKTRRIDILDFVKAAEIDDRYFETPYYLAPAKGGESAYALLRQALVETRRVGIAKFMLRDTLHLAAVEPIDDALVLTVMRFADELVAREDLALPKAPAAKKGELDVAKQLIEALAGEWKPEKYTDDYRDNLMRIIQAKRKGRTVEMPDLPDEPEAKVVDLMARLRDSLNAAKHGQAPGQSGTRKTRLTAAGARVMKAGVRAAKNERAVKKRRARVGTSKRTRKAA